MSFDIRAIHQTTTKHSSVVSFTGIRDRILWTRRHPLWFPLPKARLRISISYNYSLNTLISDASSSPATSQAKLAALSRSSWWLRAITIGHDFFLTRLLLVKGISSASSFLRSKCRWGWGAPWDHLSMISRQWCNCRRTVIISSMIGSNWALSGFLLESMVGDWQKEKSSSRRLRYDENCDAIR